MKTTHKVYFKSSTDMSDVESDSVDLMITSPPYPMIEMWDELFSSLNEDIKFALEEGEGKRAFDLMHGELNKVWKETVRVLKKGGIACVNVGDATRKINKNFQLFPNQGKITDFYLNNGCIVLPYILWRKPTNSPNKFMGSGMLPSNAYITLEHEYILIFRKGAGMRRFAPKLEERYNSAYFWEERNNWFSDVWMGLTGTNQKINKNNGENGKLRERSAAYPLQLPYRLISMYSIYGDTVLDPFWGTGTTSLAAMATARNSIGYEINPEFLDLYKKSVTNIEEVTISINNSRIQNHLDFLTHYKKKGKEINHESTYYRFPVVTTQEQEILLYSIEDFNLRDNEFHVNHEKHAFK